MKKKNMIVKCPKIWDTAHHQIAHDGDKSVNVAKLISMAAELDVYDLDIYHFSVPATWLEGCSMIDIVGHIKMILDADLSKPIIIDKDGYIADGKHRLAKALLNGERTIKAVRLDHNPYE